MKYSLLLIFFLPLSCGNGEDGNWIIPSDQVFDGGPGKDGIPSIDNPQFDLTKHGSSWNNNDLVIAIKLGNNIKAYPHPILDWHEIVNDDMGFNQYALSYCPLTGTGIAWNREVGGSITEFGVSGLLYNTNLMPYDRATNSTWSQQLLTCVEGELVRMQIETFPVVEMPWSVYRDFYPDEQVLTTETGFNRTYGQYPYNDYKTNNSKFLFPISNTDSRLPNKDRVLGVIEDGKIKAYPHADTGSPELVSDELESGREVVIYRDRGRNIIVAYESEGREMSETTAPFPAIMQDGSGNIYDVFGFVIDGVEMGARLSAPSSFIGYWFSWPAFYNDVEIYE